MIPTALRSILVYDAVHSSILLGVLPFYTSPLVDSPVGEVYFAERRSGVLGIRKKGGVDVHTREAGPPLDAHRLAGIHRHGVYTSHFRNCAPTSPATGVLR